MRGIIGSLLIAAGLAVLPLPAGAQSLGQFRWQQQPYCNVVTLTVVQDSGVYHLDGWDDQCGAPTRASAAGLAFQNRDGSIGFGLTLVTSPGATPVHIDAAISLAGLSGTWRDSTGQSGAWAFVPGGGLGGSPRPAPRAAFPAGLSAGNARVVEVGPPVNGGDATNKAYVDAGIASTRAAIVAPLNLSALTARVTGSADHVGFGCIQFTTYGSRALLELPLPIGARLLHVWLKFNDHSPEFFQFSLIGINFWDGTRSEASGPTASTVGPDRTGFWSVPLFASTALNTVRSDQTFYLKVDGMAYSGALEFCGAQVEFTMP
ncbi:MAG: hypothetical protein IT180_16900 [Acidobacteria bacterium]|nr:hypothetical protein [Acidobacteriota bacterium]